MSIEAKFLTTENRQELQLVSQHIWQLMWDSTKNSLRKQWHSIFVTNLNLLPLLGILHPQLLIHGSTLTF